MNPRLHIISRRFLALGLFIFTCFALPVSATAQNETTGSFQGRVTDPSGMPISGARVQFTYLVNEVQTAKQTDKDGNFYQGLLGPGDYRLSISKQGYVTQELQRNVFATQTNTVIPIPVTLMPETSAAVTPGPSPEPSPGPSPTATTTPQPNPTATATPKPVVPPAGGDATIEINRTDGGRGGAFTDKDVSTLPLGGTTLVRSFDELALLLPGVALPPQTQGSVAGPGVGAGVGSAGQFAVNGLRSRANNFTVDGSDNNDEDIGVRRQGFLALVPQPIESIKEYHVITLLAPAQYGRNIGAQVNAISKSGGNSTHGTIYGFFNSSQLNARNFFDTTGGHAFSQLRAGNNQQVLLDGQPLTVRNGSGGEDSFTLGQAGVVLGGPLVPGTDAHPGKSLFYFLSAEGHLLNATKESSFAVPTIEERGLFGTGATGIVRDPVSGAATRGFPTTVEGDAVFSLFPFPNNPGGIYGANTYTQELPASAQSKIASGRVDGNFRIGGRQQTFTARYNYTGDWRDIPVTGGALFSTLRPRVRTQNFSTFFNSEITDRIFNQVRLSYGRTRLVFDKTNEPSLLPSDLSPNEPFLLNSRLLFNLVLPPAAGTPNTGPINYSSCGTVESGCGSLFNGLGRIGQVNIAGYSPVGVDVFNFPQRRVNNTYQVADNLTWRLGNRHHLNFGEDIRRTELNSNLARNSRTLLTFNGAPFFDPNTRSFTRLINPINFAAAGTPSGAFLSLVRGDSVLHLRSYQLDFFGQDEWQLRRNLSISFGLRYEYNTPPRERSGRLEQTFSESLTNANISGLNRFIAGRQQIFDADRNNFAPRVGFAYSADLFGPQKATIFRAGYGLFYDQILGAVVSQSRNLPNFITVNTGGFSLRNSNDPTLRYFNPARGGLCRGPRNSDGTCPFQFFVPLVQPGTLNTINPALTQTEVLSIFGSGEFVTPFGATLPSRRLQMPMAQHYAFTVEQELGRDMVVSAAYVGTLGRHLLRFATPNLGMNNLIIPFGISVVSNVPSFFGVALAPGGGRPNSGIGPVNIYETTANSRYDALQLQARGRFRTALNYQVAYTFSKATDDVSDVFDVAGASALPQDSSDLRAERGPSNFDVRHRFSYNLIYDFQDPGSNHSQLYRAFFGGLQIASTGSFQTGQPFTVNSIFDVNLDGNLTDRLNTTNGLIVTGDRRQPLRRPTDDPAKLAAMFLAQLGDNGAIGRNTFRAGNILELDMSVIKRFAITEQQHLIFRMDIFNFINRDNFGIPVRLLEAPGFGKATDTVTPGRRIQFALKYSF